jgi:hypothetical protein
MGQDLSCDEGEDSGYESDSMVKDKKKKSKKKKNATEFFVNLDDV